jgi:hypothetical protein
VKFFNSIAFVILCCAVVACSTRPAPNVSHGSRHTYQSARTPEQAAACFARNAEEHSSALVAEVQSQPDWAQALVHVRNGVFYASAEFRRTARGAAGTIVLNVTTSGRGDDLFQELLEGC